MSDVAHSIDLNLAERLRDQAYRRRFFSAECSAEIARQLIALRKRRDLDQGEVADLIDTQQPAISRYEKADYLSRSFSVLQKIADALDARIRVLIEPAEDILGEYEEEQAGADSEVAALKEILRARHSSELEKKSLPQSPRRLGALRLDDDTSAASYRPEIPKLVEVPKLLREENSAALH